MSTSARLRLLGTVAFAALSASFAAPAFAQQQAEVEFDNDNAPGNIITVINTISALPPVIVSLQTVTGANTGTSTTTGSFVFQFDSAVGNNDSFTASSNLLTARTRGLNADNSVGTANTDGAIILVGQQIVPNGAAVTELAATLNDSTVGWLLNGPTASNVTANVDSNTAQAYTTFNSNFATIDTDVPVGLDPLVASYEAAWDLAAADTATYFLTDIDQIANFNVTSAQVNFGFANGNAANLPTSSVDDTTVVLAYLMDPAEIGGNTASGTFSVDGNTTNAVTQGNAADLSVFLFDAGASVLTGSAAVSSTQSSSDSTAPTGEFPGISAANQDTTIAAVFATETQGFPPPLAFGQPDILSAVDLTVSVSGNTVASSATINTTRNTIGLEGTLDIDNDTDESTINVGAGVTPGQGATEADALIIAVNNQTAASGNVTTGSPDAQLTGGSAPQAAVALTEDALIVIGVEDVNADSLLTLSDNTISASATGQFGSNTIQNNGEIVDVDGDVTDLGTGTANIVGTFGTLNRQLLVHPEISAEVTGSTIGTLVGADELLAEAFGGLVDSVLIVGDDPSTVDVNEGNLFQASATGNSASQVIDLNASTIVALGAGLVESENNQTVTDYTFSTSDAGINMLNWQFQNLAGDDDAGSVFAGLNDVDIEVFVNYSQGVVGSTEDPIEIENATINVDGNGGTASASLNSYAGLADITTILGFEGSIAQLSHQYTNGVDEVQYTAESEVVGANISVDLGVNGAAENINASVSGNSYLSLTNGNDSVQVIDMVAGTTIDTDADTIAGDNAVIADNVQNPNIETRVTDIEGAAAFIAVSDQTLRATIAEARVDDVELELLLAAPAAGVNSLSGGVLALSDNALVAQVLGNNATNSVSVEAGTSIVPLAESGAIAGAVSSQSSVAQDDQIGATALQAESFYEAEVLGSSIHADVMTAGLVDSVSDVTLNVDGNTITALTRANSVNNTVSVTANDLQASFTTGAVLESENISANDMTLTVDDSALYILNRQRNEGNNTDAQLGPSVSSFLSNNSVTATLNGGTLGVDTVTLSLSGNAMQGIAAGNVAGNTISINPESTVGTADASAGILNRQGNSGNIEVDIDGANVIEASVTGATGATHANLVANVDGNVISGSATGSSATNSIVASGNTLNGDIDPAVDSVYIGPSGIAPSDQIGSVLTDTNTLDSNADAFVSGNLAILNTQRNYGIPGNDSPDVPNLINSEVENSTFSLNIVGDVSTTNSALSLSGNQLTSQAGANQATNSIAMTAQTGLPTYASVLNNQGVQQTQVSSAATDTEITLNLSGDFASGTTAVDGNTVLASSTLNSATNTVTAQTTVGSLPGATIVNYQTSTDSSASATNSGTVISHTSLGGTISGSTSTVSGNQIGSSATINNVTNTISSPGQTFTRTSSF